MKIAKYMADWFIGTGIHTERAYDRYLLRESELEENEIRKKYIKSWIYECVDIGLGRLAPTALEATVVAYAIASKDYYLFIPIALSGETLRSVSVAASLCRANNRQSNVKTLIHEQLTEKLDQNFDKTVNNINEVTDGINELADQMEEGEEWKKGE